MRTKCLVACLVGVVLLLLASSLNAEMRTWTRKNGTTFEAEFVKREGPVVTLKKPGGTEMTVHMPKLSDEDRKYVNQLTKGKDKAGAKDSGGQKTADQPTPPASVEEPKHTGKKKHGKKPFQDNTDVAHKDKPSPEPDTAADQSKTMIVEAKGSGKDRDEALKDAFREAVRKVVGAYVEEESVVRNDKLIEDVRTYSGGCVKDHGIVSDYKDGSITIWALVEQDKVVKRLKAASVSVKDVAGGKMWDEIQSKRWKDKEPADLLRSVLKGFPANCMRAEIVGEPKHEDKDNKIQVAVEVNLFMDEKAFEAFRERLIVILDHIANESKELLWTYEKRHTQEDSTSIRNGKLRQSSNGINDVYFLDGRQQQALDYSQRWRSCACVPEHVPERTMDSAGMEAVCSFPEARRGS